MLDVAPLPTVELIADRIQIRKGCMKVLVADDRTAISSAAAR